MSIAHTRAIVRAVVQGRLHGVTTHVRSVFGALRSPNQVSILPTESSRPALDVGRPLCLRPSGESAGDVRGEHSQHRKSGSTAGLICGFAIRVGIRPLL